MPAGSAATAGKRLQSCPHRAHAAASGAASAGRLPRGENQTARRRRLRSALALPVLRVLRSPVHLRHPRQLRFQASCRAAAEAVKTQLSPYPTPAAQLLQLPPPRPQLAAPAPHLLQGRTLRRRNATCASSLPTAPDLPPKSSLSTTIAASARTASRSSRTASAPTA